MVTPMVYREYARSCLDRVIANYESSQMDIGFESGPAPGWTIPGKNKIYLDLDQHGDSEFVNLFDGEFYRDVLVWGDLKTWYIQDTVRHEVDHNVTGNGAACPGDARTNALINRAIIMAANSLHKPIDSCQVAQLSNVYTDLVIDADALERNDDYGASCAMSRRSYYQSNASEENDFFYSIFDNFAEGFIGAQSNSQVLGEACEIIENSNRSNYPQKAYDFACLWLQEFPPTAPWVIMGRGSIDEVPFDGDLQNDSGIPIAAELSPNDYKRLRDSLGLPEDGLHRRIEWYRSRIPRLLAKNSTVKQGLDIPVSTVKSQGNFDLEKTLERAAIVHRKGKIAQKVLSFYREKSISIEGSVAEEEYRPFHIVLDVSGSMGGHGDTTNKPNFNFKPSDLNLAVTTAMAVSRLKNNGVKGTLFGADYVTTGKYLRSANSLDSFFVDTQKVNGGGTTLPRDEIKKIKPKTATFLITDGEISALSRSASALEYASSGDNYLAVFLIGTNPSNADSIPANDIIFIDDSSALPGTVVDFARRNSKVKRNG